MMNKEVIVKSHAIGRYMSDRFNNKLNSTNQARKEIEKSIRHSFLIKLNKDGTELRGHNGKVYVCANSEHSVTVITVLKANNFT